MAGYVIFNNDEFNGSLNELTRVEHIVYLTLRSFTHEGKQIAFPSYQTIADICKYSRRYVIDAVKSLVAKGLIKKQLRKKDAKTHYSNLYTLLKFPSKKGSEMSAPKETNSSNLKQNDDNNTPTSSLNSSEKEKKEIHKKNYVRKPVSQAVTYAIKDAVFKHVPKNVYLEANINAGESFAESVWLMLIKQFPEDKLSPKAVQMASERYFDRTASFSFSGITLAFRPKNPLGLFHRCYEEAVISLEYRKGMYSRQ